jgi:ribose 1,5-bisphosphate isomerase
MDYFQKTLRDIKSIKIQGATNVALSAVKAFEWKAKRLRCKDREKFLSKLKRYQRMLISTRPTEPLMRNVLRYIMSNLERKDIAVSEIVPLIKSSYNEFLFNAKKEKEQIARIGSRMIKNGMTVFTHCHSSTVMGVLKYAWKEGKRFEVIHTESRPRYQGHITAKELTRAGIPTTMVVDSAISTYIRKADLAIVGADVITADGNLINKIGTLYLALASKRVGVPFYSATVLTKFDPETVFGKPEDIEMRSPKEVWKNPPRKLRILNPAFDITPREIINAYITEEGLVNPEAVPDKVEKYHPWVFSGVKG